MNQRRQAASREYERRGRYFYRNASWLMLFQSVDQFATINDLVVAAHGRQEVARAALQELADIYAVAACFYERVRELPPFVRLQWVDVLGAAPGPVDLRDLSILPDWPHVERLQRRDLQQLVGWLYEQVDAEQEVAVGFIHDLVRATVMLASHSPVNQVLTAEVLERRAIVTGSHLDLVADARRLRVGLHVMLYEDGRSSPAARGLVEDLSDGIATVRITCTRQGESAVVARAEISEPARSAPVALGTGRLESIGVATSLRGKGRCACG
jgi:hypothetical protein